MKPPTFVRFLTAEERQALRAGPRSADAFTLRRCQILLASARDERPGASAHRLGGSDQPVRTVLHAFHRDGLGALAPGSSRPHTIHAAFDAARAERLRQVLHRRPSEYGKPTEGWTLELAAEVAFELGLTPSRVSGETVRATLARLGVGWRRAKRWITSPDPAYAQQNATGTA